VDKGEKDNTESTTPPVDQWAQSGSEEDVDWADLESEFGNLTEGAADADNWTELSAQDIDKLSERPPLNIDPEDPPKLKEIHYNMIKKVDWELYEEWSNLRTVQWKLQNKLRPLSKYTFNPQDVKEYDRIPEWNKPRVKGTKKTCRFCVPDETEEKKMQITFTNLELLHDFINERGMIFNRRITGNCGKHQRKVAKAIKRARIAGLLAFTSNWKIPQTFMEPVYQVDGSRGDGLADGAFTSGSAAKFADTEAELSGITLETTAAEEKTEEKSAAEQI